jgi:hypothetical protein
MPIAWTKPVCIGWYREVANKGLDGQLVHTMIMVPPPLDSLDSQIHCTLKPFGLLASKRVGRTFTEKVRSLILDSPLHDPAEALLRV